MNERSGSNLKAKLILLAGVFSCSMSSAFFRYMTAPSTIAATYRLGWTVLLLTPNFRAVWRTVALVSIIYSAVFTARSSIYPFMQYPKVCLYILFGQRGIYDLFLKPASHKNEDSHKRSSYLQFCEILSSTF